MSEDDLSSQNDEIAALTAIFGPETWVRDLTRPIEAFPQYSILVRADDVLAALDPDARGKCVTLRVTLPPSYPSDSPPAYEIEGPWLKRSQRQKMQAELEEVYLENIGENVVFQWIDKIREILNEIVAECGDVDIDGSPLKSTASVVDGRLADANENDLDKFVGEFDERLELVDDAVVVVENPAAYPVGDDDTLWDIPEIFSGEPITDRKSTFQAFLAHVVHPKQAMCVLAKLKENKKIANACHNMWAYRIGDDGKSKTSSVIARCDDDGEAHAGGRMLHLLEILDANNVMVIVTRWYGGILLGPDRFKHISNVTRNILEQNGFLKEKKEAAGGKSGKKKT